MLFKLPNISPKLLPRGELAFVFHTDEKGDIRYLITAKPDRSTWFIYEFTEESFRRLGRGGNPNDLEEKYIPWCKK